METSKYTEGDGHLNKHSTSKSTAEATNEHYEEAKERAKTLYKEGMETFEDVQATVKEYSHAIWKNASERPLTTLLVAGGVGLLVGGITLLIHSLTTKK